MPITDLFDPAVDADFMFDDDTSLESLAGLTVDADPATMWAIAAVNAAVAHTTGDDLANWQTTSTYDGDVFALRGSTDDYAISFVWNAERPLLAGWYKELGRGTVINRRVTAGELHQLVTACLDTIAARHSTPIPAELEVYCYAAEHQRTIVDILAELAA